MSSQTFGAEAKGREIDREREGEREREKEGEREIERERETHARVDSSFIETGDHIFLFLELSFQLVILTFSYPWNCVLSCYSSSFVLFCFVLLSSFCASWCRANTSP